MGIEIIRRVLVARLIPVKRNCPALEMHRGVSNFTFLGRFSIRRVVVVVINLEGIARLDIALKIYLIGEHMDELHDHARRNAGLHGGEVKARIDPCPGAVVMRLKFLEVVLGCEPIVRAARDAHVVLDSWREAHR